MIDQFSLQIIELMRLLFLLLAVFPFTAISFKDCNFTQFDFFSHYSLGRTDQINKTLDSLNTKMSPLQKIQINSDLYLYTVFNATTQFEYIDSKQKATIVGNDLIVINGGYAQTNIVFSWSKDKVVGSGLAICRTDGLELFKQLYLQAGFLVYNLSDYSHVQYERWPCNIVRLDPVPESKDLEVIQKIFNDATGKNVKDLITKEAQKYYETQLKKSLYDQRQLVNSAFNYTWKQDEKSPFTINYTALPTGSHLVSAGLSLYFVTQITNDDDWTCGGSVPSQPKNLSQYGGVHEYLSLSIIENTIRYAANKGVFNAKLTKKDWESNVFQFFVGDLYDIIPKLATKYYASTPVDGVCNTAVREVKTSIVSKNKFQFSLPYSCQLFVTGTTISNFDTDITFQIEIVPMQSELTFIVSKISKMAHFKDVGEYQIHDIELANFFLTKSLNDLIGQKVFGSGWNTYNRDYPQVIIQNGYVLVYDAANISYKSSLIDKQQKI